MKKHVIVIFFVYLIDLSLLALLLQYTPLYYTLAVGSSFLAARVFSYFGHRYWTFDKVKNSHTKAFFRIILTSLLGAVASMAGVAFFVEIIGMHPLLGRIAIGVFITIAAFFVNKFYVFKAE